MSRLGFIAQSQQKQSLGFSLIELLVALGLGILLLFAMLQLYLMQKSHYRLQEGLARLQESARFSQKMLAHDLRMAGYQGCSHHEQLVPIQLSSAPPADLVFTNQDLVRGYDGNGGGWSPSRPSHITGIKPNTDVITVRYASPTSSSQLTSNMASTDAVLAVANHVSFSSGDFLLITDCSNSDIFTASENTNNTQITHTNTDNSSDDLSKAYANGARVSHFIAYTYYLKDSGRTNQTGQPVYALYRLDLSGTETEISDGIENLQIQYGIDSTQDGSVDTFTTANSITDWSQVKSARVTLLVSSVEQSSSHPVAYTFQGNTVTPTDHQIRRQWDQVITFRNRNF